MINTKELPLNSAIGVEAKGVVELKEGDSVLIGVRAVFDGKSFHPTSKRLQLIPDIFDDIKNDELLILKRVK